MFFFVSSIQGFANQGSKCWRKHISAMSVEVIVLAPAKGAGGAENHHHRRRASRANMEGREEFDEGRSDEGECQDLRAASKPWANNECLPSGRTQRQVPPAFVHTTFSCDLDMFCLRICGQFAVSVMLTNDFQTIKCLCDLQQWMRRSAAAVTQALGTGTP